MTIRQAMQTAQSQLQSKQNDEARFDSICLAEHAFNLDKTQLRLNADQPIDPTQYFELVSRRAAGEPLQYILGEWEFYGLPFAVGPGALIPRPETEMLVELALNFLRTPPGPSDHPPLQRGERLPQEPQGVSVVDLCAGTGCVGLSIAHHCPNAQVHLLELSEHALPYLHKNASRYPNAHIHHADIFNCALRIANCELILTNPPYIPTEELPRLSREVRQEPALALDGGPDGLAFYRAIADIWLPRLSPGGMLAAECGEGQAAQIAAMFAPYQTEIHKDFNGIERIVSASP